MKKIKKTLLSTLRNELHINLKRIDLSQSFSQYIAINSLEFNLLLYYVEDKLSMEIADEKVSMNQSIDEFVKTLYSLKVNTKLSIS
jgi:acyl carrier protein